MNTESWLAIPGFDGYEVSSLGGVRSVTRTLADGRTFKGRTLKAWETHGYKHVSLPGKKMSVHRLVCLAFHGEPPLDKPWALHKNGKHQENTADNLYWGDAVDNARDAVKHGTHPAPNQGKTHCKYGHEFTPENTYNPPKTGYRHCKTCQSRRNLNRKKE